MNDDTGHISDLLIFTFPGGSSLSRWERFGVIDREVPFLQGVAASTRRMLFVSTTGEDERRIASELRSRMGIDVHAISEKEPDPDLGTHRTLEERVLAYSSGARRVVIQTMQYDDAGLARRLLNPLRRTGASVALVARGTFIDSRVLATTHGPHHFRTLTAGEAEHAVCSNAQIVVATSESMADELCWKNGLNPARTRIISQHIAITDLSTERVDNLIVTSGRFSGGCTGIRMAIEAVSKLSEAQRAKIGLEIIGDGPEGRDLPEYADELGVKANFRRGCAHDELVEALSAATVYIQCEIARRQSYNVLEAMAIGCPVVVNDLPEYNGLIHNGHTGIRVTQEPEAFAFAIDCLLGDRSFRDMLGEAAHQQISFQCSVERVVRETIDCYRDALAAAPKQETLRGKHAS